MEISINNGSTLTDMRKAFRRRKQKLLEQAAEVEQYIRTIEDSRMRRIIQYRVIDGLSWYEVADRIGGKATSESCRKYFERFLGKC